MGTRGYKVYRYKHRYLVRLNRFDSEPADFGRDVVLREIPRRGVSKEKFEEWVRSTREYLDAKFEKLAMKPTPDTEYNEYVTDQIPYYPHYPWVYEIDLDNLVFLVNHIPMFRLDNMPPGKVFVKSISYDHFGHIDLLEHTPVQYRYNWHAPPPSPSSESLTAYKSCPNRSSTSSIHELLSTPMELSSIERARTALVGHLITRFMIEHNIACYLRYLEKVPDRHHMSKRICKLGLSFVNFAAGPPIPSLPCNASGITWDFIWIRRDVCLRITTHLDDEENLQASIGDLIHHINETHSAGTFYGIAFSIFHCAIVRHDIDEQGTSFTHTPALQFLPSFYAKKICTPGIEALSRLGCRASGVEFLHSIFEAHDAGLIKRAASPSDDKKPKKDDFSLADDPEEVRVRKWRHELQKTFLNDKGTGLKPEEMPASNELFIAIEQYDKMNSHYLSYSRMGQVMRRIHLQPLDKVPRDEEFQFRSRAKALVDKWDVILSAYKDVGPGTNGRARLTHGRSKSVASKIPVEIWRIVGDFFTSPIDLVNLAYVSPQALSAAAELARYPWVLEYRLVDAIGSITPIPETTEQTNIIEISRYCHQLGRAKFTAIKGNRRVTVELGQGLCTSWLGSETGNSFSVMSYSDYILTKSKEPYVLELDGDESN